MLFLFDVEKEYKVTDFLLLDWVIVTNMSLKTLRMMTLPTPTEYCNFFLVISSNKAQPIEAFL